MSYLFWIDLEMTGLDPIRDRILELALIVTSLNLETIFEYQTVVFQEPDVLLNMDVWCRDQHGKSGLSAKVPFGKKQEVVDAELAEILLRFHPQHRQGDSSSSASPPFEKAILAGNSIHCDRKFIDQWLPITAQLLHYRMLDVSSFKILFQKHYGKKFQKRNQNHRALDDILESIAELKYYQQFIVIQDDVFKEIE
ncbi:MAG: oligoribonuclease [Silvanigrellaceae bacterium]|nr:oligoribonuclease [Silvanigrellaceae bacterium]